MTDEIYWREFDATWRAALDGLRRLLRKRRTNRAVRLATRRGLDTRTHIPAPKLAPRD